MVRLVRLVHLVHLVRVLPPGKRLYRFVALPSREELKVFLNFAGPIAFALLGKVARKKLSHVETHPFVVDVYSIVERQRQPR